MMYLSLNAERLKNLSYRDMLLKLLPFKAKNINFNFKSTEITRF